MFRNRQSSQKPPTELFQRFRESFPDVRTCSAPAEQPGAPVLAGGVVENTNAVNFTNHQDLDPTPRAEPFRFTPSLTPSVFMDPTSSAFTAFANQPPGLFTPTPGASTATLNGLSALAPPPAPHDIGLSLESPMALQNGSTMLPTTSDGQLYAAPQAIQPQFGNFNFNQPGMPPQYLDPSQYAPRPPSGPGSPMDLSGTDILGGARPLDGILSLSRGPPTSIPMDDRSFDQLSRLIPDSGEKFRFHIVLNAPTAMIKHPEEIPVTYLNKGQAYTISIIDTAPPPPGATPVKYRTFIRISFHDEAQRSRPAQCWQLWKEGRGTNEAHQRGGKLQAVEYVEPPNIDDEDSKKGKVELESSWFDGFAVTWSPGTNDATETSVSVRFNFLSTDFSHSKGVKGIPVRLCAKTVAVPTGSPKTPQEAPEICYCKVKLFRDHGAERKLANDILHVRKTIEKLKQQANQIDGTGMKVYSKKAKKPESIELNGVGKAHKHKRSWSMSSASSVGGSRTQEEDTAMKLQSMEDMFTSTRPFSVLYLKGEDGDDPDLYPVRLSGDHNHDDPWRRRESVAHSTATSFVSPTPSSVSLSSQRGASFSPDKDWDGRNYRPGSHTEGPMRVKVDNMLSGWIEAIGIDPNYKAPEPPAKAVMCVYVLPIIPDHPEKNQYYRAVYLASRSASALASSIASRCGIDPSSVVRTVHINSKGLNVFVDDDFVDQMNEGQDMKIEVHPVEDDSIFPGVQDQWQNGNHANGDSPNKRWELRLIY
ncbi:hypothetical protein EX30DRAFT_269609 [Ascodesmis nigricans]|uniref:Grh/CP2 DB domain-containing protein n=1 Tax=Ascodesmis nigricans TaxID=341454 RepID=A0A4S2MX90_9PEZI|nr:hypothetical protein EX30DRAFT_269609 [Ascodesmis nigricans]